MTSVELFAGAGGLALGLEQAGFEHLLVNELMKDCCDTLRKNRPNWNVVHKQIGNAVPVNMAKAIGESIRDVLQL